MVDIGPLSTVEVLQVYTGETAGVFQASKAHPILEGERVCPSHLGGCVRLSRGGLGVAFIVQAVGLRRAERRSG